ncbi:MAG: HDOD domain-containing protein [Candidatus Thiodiazotropha endolucinida]
MGNFIPTIVRHAKLPSPSPVISKVLELLYIPDTDIDELVDAMKGDSGLTAKVLRSANSAMSAPVKKVGTLKEAVLRIGLIPTINIITATEIANLFYSVPLPYGDAFKLWEHNVLVACLSEAYAKHYKLDYPGRWFSAGLMHDIGRLLLIHHNPAKYSEVIELAKSEEIELSQAEQRVMGFAHDELGGILLEFWEMPGDLAKAAYGHHKPFENVDDYGSGIGVCNQIANDLMMGEKPKISDIPAVPVEKLVANAAEMFEIIKEASGFSPDSDS